MGGWKSWRRTITSSHRRLRKTHRIFRGLQRRSIVALDRRVRGLFNKLIDLLFHFPREVFGAIVSFLSQGRSRPSLVQWIERLTAFAY